MTARMRSLDSNEAIETPCFSIENRFIFPCIESYKRMFALCLGQGGNIQAGTPEVGPLFPVLRRIHLRSD